MSMNKTLESGEWLTD